MTHVLLWACCYPTGFNVPLDSESYPAVLSSAPRTALTFQFIPPSQLQAHLLTSASLPAVDVLGLTSQHSQVALAPCPLPRHSSCPLTAPHIYMKCPIRLSCVIMKHWHCEPCWCESLTTDCIITTVIELPCLTFPNQHTTDLIPMHMTTD